MKALDELLLDAPRIAREHVLWAASQRIRPRELLNLVGINWPERSDPNWHDCVNCIAHAWRQIQRGAHQRKAVDAQLVV